jgi:hypothetical protein
MKIGAGMTNLLAIRNASMHSLRGHNKKIPLSFFLRRMGE